MADAADGAADDARTLTMPDGRTVGYATFGDPDGLPVLWCHGGPGSRLEPAAGAEDAVASGVRLIGIDRPGYGRSTPWPGRAIADWVPDGLALADALGVDEFVAVGVSTGGAYAAALAATVPERVLGLVTCCALTDMRWEEGKAMMAGPEVAGIWASSDREAALDIAVEVLGEDGSKMMSGAQADDGGPALPEADLALFADPIWLAGLLQGAPQMFAFGVQGYVDDRIADGVGWGSFDAGTITCPAIVLHGGSDTVVPVAHAHHTAAIIPGAELRVFEPLGHFSIAGEVATAVADVRERADR